MMKRTQIYLTAEEREALKSIAERLGISQSSVIREAVDRYVIAYQTENRLQIMRQARGLWKGREDLPDFQVLRQELDRLGNADKGNEDVDPSLA
jgi:hypothetical protein